MSFTEAVIRRPSLIVVIFAVLTVLGLVSYQQLSYELLPKISPPVISITTIYPGASPSEVEDNVTKKVEDAVSTLDKIDFIRSTSSEGVSSVIIQFVQEANINQSLQDATRKLNAVRGELPTDVEEPIIDKIALDEIPVIRAGISANIEPKAFYTEVEERIKPLITQVPGVGAVTLLGGSEREIQVNVDPDRLKVLGVSLAEINGVIAGNNVDYPTGNVKETKGQFTVRVAGKFNNLEELRQLVIRRGPDGSELRLGEVADINDGIKEPTNYIRINGTPSLSVLIQKQSDANAVEVSRLVREKFEAIEKRYASSGVKFNIAIDTSEYTIKAADAVIEDLFLAILLVAGVMLLFLHSLRNSLIVMVAIPSSLISVFTAMYVLDYTLNLMTLLGLSLVIGILVDDSIVVLENIYRHLEMGKPARKAAVDGRQEIGFTALSITLVDVVVFVPLAVLSGIVGQIMREFSVVVVISTLMSLFVSFTVTPVLASRFARLEHPNPKSFTGRFTAAFEAFFRSLQTAYANLLRAALRPWYNRAIVGLVTLLLLISSFIPFGLGIIGGTFIEQDDRGEFAITLELPAGAKLEETNQLALQVEKKLLSNSQYYIQRIFSNVGASSDGFLSSSSSNIAELTILLKDYKERPLSTDQLAQTIKRDLLSIPGAEVRVALVGIFGTADETPIQMYITGATYEDVQNAGNTMLTAMRKIEGTSDVQISVEDGKPETKIILNQTKMAEFGISTSQVGSELRTALTGFDDSKYRDNNTEYDIRVRLNEFDRSQIDKLKSLSFRTPDGHLVELQQFAEIIRTTGPTKLERYNRTTATLLSSQAVGRQSGDIGNDLKAALASAQLPTSVGWEFIGQVKDQESSFGSMGAALLIGILFVYLIMVALYDSYIYPFVVLFAIPVATVGAFYALALALKPMSIFTMLGLIMLIGLVTKNAILLVDFTNQARAEGKSTFDALIEAGKERLRPILMTTLAMVFGMLPIATASGAGAQWKQGLAWALIGGLTSSMLLTLVVVPTVYISVDNSIQGIRKLLTVKKPLHVKHTV